MDLYSEFIDSYNNYDYSRANKCLIKALGRVLVDHKLDFVHLLNESGIKASEQMSDNELIELFFSNIEDNKRLSLGSALLLNIKNQDVNFDGEINPDSESVKAGYRVFRAEYSNSVTIDGPGMEHLLLKTRPDKKKELFDIENKKKNFENEMKFETQNYRHQKVIDAIKKESDKKEQEKKEQKQKLKIGIAVTAVVLVLILVFKGR